MCLLRDDKLDDGEFDLETHGHGQDQDLGRGMTLQRRIHIDFSNLAMCLSRLLPSEGSVLLLYELLLGHPSFVDMLVRGKGFGPVLSGVVKGLYDIAERSCSLDNQYVLIVCCLMLVQDTSLRALLPLTSAAAPWYRERVLSDSSLCDLVVLCTLRTAMFALYSLRDQYLLQNCYAILLNLAPVVSKIHVYTAERFVRVLIQVSRRVVRDSAGVGEGGGNIRADAGDVKELLGVLLKVLGTILRPRRRTSNVQLLYSLLQEHEKVLELFAQPVVQQQLDEGQTIDCCTLQELSELVEQSLAELYRGEDDVYFAAGRAVEVLSASLVARARTEPPVDELETGMITYSYVETESPESFFVPCAWANTLRIGQEVEWHPLKITLFDAVGDVVSEEATQDDKV